MGLVKAKQLTVHYFSLKIKKIKHTSQWFELIFEPLPNTISLGDCR